MNWEVCSRYHQISILNSSLCFGILVWCLGTSWDFLNIIILSGDSTDIWYHMLSVFGFVLWYSVLRFSDFGQPVCRIGNRWTFRFSRDAEARLRAQRFWKKLCLGLHLGSLSLCIVKKISWLIMIRNLQKITYYLWRLLSKHVPTLMTLVLSIWREFHMDHSLTLHQAFYWEHFNQ